MDFRRRGKKADKSKFYVGTVVEKQAVLADTPLNALHKLERRNPKKHVTRVTLAKGMKQKNLDRGF